MKRTSNYLQILAATLLLVAFLFPQLSIAQQKHCIAEDNGTGTIDWPAQCPYGNVLDPIRVISASGEQIEISIEIPPMSMTCRPGTNPPKYDSGLNSPPGNGRPIAAFINLARKGNTVTVPVDLILSVSNSPRNSPGDDVQVFDTEILSMVMGRPPMGHPIFPEIHLDFIPAGGGATDGQTTITRLPSGDFTVDSFFDIAYRISAKGAEGTDFEGVSIDSTGTTRLTQTLHCLDGVPYSPEGDANISQSDEGIVIDNLGSSGLDGVRFSIGDNGINGGVGGCSVRMKSLDLPTEGDHVSFSAYPPPNRTSGSEMPTKATLTRVGSELSIVCSSGAMGATEWVVEVWEGGTLKGVGIRPDNQVCVSDHGGWITVESWSLGVEREVDDTGENGASKLRTSLIFRCSGVTEVTIPGQPIMTGDRVVCSPRDPQVLPRMVSGIRICGSTTSEDVWVERCVVSPNGYGGGMQGLDDAVLKTQNGRLVADNLGSSGCDGVSISLGGGGGGSALPFEVELSPLDVQNSGGGFFMEAKDAAGNSLIESEYRTGTGGSHGGQGGCYVKTPAGMNTCRVTVLRKGVHVGEFDVPLTAGVQTRVCDVGQGVDGYPLLTGCGKRAIGWPWDLSCLVQEFDRPIEITPTGGTPMVGDELQLLLPDATPQAVASLRTIELRASGIPQIEFCGFSSGNAPPAPVLSAEDILNFTYPGAGSRMSDSVPKYYTASNNETICIFSSLTDLEVLSTNGDSTTYSANLRWKIDGIEGNAIDRTLDIPGTITMRTTNTCCIGNQDQLRQFSTQVTGCNFALPAGDADFAQLRVRGGSDLGFDSPGDVIITKIPECVFIIEEIQKILAEIDITGTAGGGLSGGTITGASLEQNLHLTKPEVLFDGMMHKSLGFGTAISVTPDGRMQIDNLGSSGCDGVSISCPDPQGFEVCFDELSPPDLLEGGTLSFEEFGSLPGQPVAGSLGTCVITAMGRRGSADSFFDICYDFDSVSPSSTTIQVYDQGTLVAEVPMPSSAACFEMRSGATGLPMLSTVGKLPGLSAVPCKVIRWWQPGMVHIQGQPPVVGDEVRLLANGVAYESISRFELRASDEVDHCIFIKEEVGTHFGRKIHGSGFIRLSRASMIRRNRSGFVVGSDDERFQVAECRFDRAVQGVVDGSMTVHVSGVEMGSLDSEMAVETTGQLPGSTSPQSLGTCTMRNSGGGEVELSSDFSAIGNSQVRLKLYSTGDRAGENPLYCGDLVHNSVIPDGAPLAYLKYKLDRAWIKSWSTSGDADDRPTEEVAFYYNKITFTYHESVEVRLAAGGPPVSCNRIEVMVVNPTSPSADPEDNWVRTRRLKPFTITGISTGPGFPDGLPVISVGSGDVELDSQGNLRVSNLGSSGLDGVRIDLGNGSTGGQIDWQPIDVSGGKVRVSVVEPCAGVPENCPDGSEMAAVTIDDGAAVDSFFDIYYQLAASPAQAPEVICFDENGAITGRSTIQFDSFFDVFPEVRIGSIVPVAAQGKGRVTGCGISPAVVIPGDGYIPRGIRIDFEEPMQFVSDDTFTTCQCTHLIVAGCIDEDCNGIVCTRPSILETTFSGISQATMTDGRVFVFGRAFSSIGESRLDTCVRGSLTIDNLGSSGCNGVSMSNPGGGGFETEIVSMDLAGGPPITTGVTPPPPGGFESFEVSGMGAVDGTPSPLGSMTLPLGSSEPFVELRTNFAILLDGSGRRVNVCGDTGGSFDVAPVDAASCYLYPGGASVVGVCRLAERDTPTGQDGPGYRIRFDQPVEVTPVGGAAGSGFVGTCVEVRATRTSGTWDTEMLSMDLLKTVPDGPHAASAFIKIEGITGESPDKSPNSFGDWLVEHFTPAEIAELEAAGYQADGDGDERNVIEEFVTRTDPKQADAQDRTATTEAVTSPEDEEFIRYAYQISPYVEGVEILLRTTNDLKQWDESPGQMRLVEINPLPNGNTEYVWESVSPISAHRTKHHGHVTILK